MKIPVVIFKDPDSVFGTSVPDVRGLHCCGNTLDEARRNTLAALYSHIKLLRDLGEKIELQPSPLTQLQADPGYAGGTWHHIYVDPALLLACTTPATPQNISVK